MLHKKLGPVINEIQPNSFTYFTCLLDREQFTFTSKVAFLFNFGQKSLFMFGDSFFYPVKLFCILLISV